MKLAGWRIADPAYSNSIAEMLSGEGSFLFAGRWNNEGTRVVYLGNSIAQAAMELLVHLQYQSVLQQFCKLEVFFDEELVEYIRIEDLPKNWSRPTMASDVRDVGDAWVQSESSVVLRVPSAATPGENNYLLNPQHPDFKKLTFGNIEAFNFDERIAKKP